jgi:hypothetical protein
LVCQVQAAAIAKYELIGSFSLESTHQRLADHAGMASNV